MKTTIELNGHNIVIDENEGVISVTAEKDEEVIEEFTIDTNEDGEAQDKEETEEGQELKEFGQDEIEEGQEEVQEGEEDFEEGQEEEEEGQKLESFRSFMKKRK